MELIEYTDPFEANGYAHSDDIYLDIETTGVRRYADFAWCIGYSYLSKDKIQSRQIFLKDTKNELASLALIQHELERFKRVVTFNGDVFDLPFLISRAQGFGMQLKLPQERLDLYKLLRSNKKFMMFDKINLKTAEILSGIERNDDLSGYETIKLYKEVIRTGEKNKKKQLLNHNYYDIKNLPILMKIFLPIKKARTIDLDRHSFFVSDFYITNDLLEVKLSIKTETPKIKYFDENITIENINSNIFIRFATKTALKDGHNLRYFSHNKRVFEIEKFYYPIIKEEIEKILVLVIPHSRDNNI